MRRERALLVLGLLVVVVGLVLAWPSHPVQRLRTLSSLRRVDDYPLYAMTYYGDCGFGRLVQEGLEASTGLDRPAAGAGWACTCFAAFGAEGQALFGRNFDWKHEAALFLSTDPGQGLASASMVDIGYLGYDHSEPSWLDCRRLLAAPHLPFDGMNEYGMAVGMMAVPQARCTSDPQRMTLDSLRVMRLLLDYARDVDEAVALVPRFNVSWGSGPPLHYLIADRGGRSALIEFVEGEMRVLRSDSPWQVATNFVLSTLGQVSPASRCGRYARVEERLARTEGRLTAQEALGLLQEVSQPNTMWSVVYDLHSGEIWVAMGGDYEQVHHFDLDMER